MTRDRGELRSITSATVPDSLEWEDFSKYLAAVDPVEINGIHHAFNTSKGLHFDHAPRDTGGPFSEHPLMVARYLTEAGCVDPSVLKAALLHDGAEDHMDKLRNFGQTSSPYRRVGPFTFLSIHFGAETSGIVRFLSKPELINPTPRQRARMERVYIQTLLETLGSEEENRYRSKARLVKLADRLHNFRTLPWRDYDSKLLAQDRDRAQRKLLETEVDYIPVFKIAEREFPLVGGTLVRHLHEDINQLTLKLAA